MRVVAWGNVDRYLAPFSAGSGYVVEDGGSAILLDCGHGVAASGAFAAGAEAVAGVVVSHMHFDHCADLMPVLASAPRARLLLPPEGLRSCEALARAFRFDGAFAHAGGVEEAAGGSEVAVGPFRLRAAEGRHSAPSLAWRIEAGGRALVYASDGAPCGAVRDLARGADVLLAHTLLPDVEAGSDHARIHATAASAGALAEEARVARLVLSHRFHGVPAERYVEAARARFSGAVVLARRGEPVEV